MILPPIRKFATVPSLADNGSDTQRAYLYRELYYQNYFAGSLKPYAIDLWYEKPLYGRVDQDQNIITPVTTALRVLDGEIVTYALNFVADAFNDLRAEFARAYSTNRINQNTHLKSLTPTTAWKDPEEAYVSYLRRLYGQLADQINASYTYVSIYDFKTFLNYMFGSSLVFNKERPLTRINFLTSRRVPVNVSGLVVEIDSDLLKSDDADKTFFVADSNYTFAIYKARKFGFYVDKNAPWRFVANPRSTAMEKYMKKYGYNNYTDLFEKAYKLAYKDDYEAFKTVVLSFYQSYVNANPTFDFGGTCGSSIAPKSRVYRFTRNLSDQGVSEEKLFDYYLLSRFREDAGVDDVSYSRRIKQFKRKTRGKPIAERLEVLNETLNKHIDIVTLKQPRRRDQIDSWGGVADNEAPGTTSPALSAPTTATVTSDTDFLEEDSYNEEALLGAERV